MTLLRLIQGTSQQDEVTELELTERDDGERDAHSFQSNEANAALKR